MPINSIIIIAAIALLVLTVALWRRFQTAAAIIIVVGVAITAGIVTAIYVNSYHARPATEAALTSPTPSAALPPPQQQFIVPAATPAPAAMQGPTGGASPAPAYNNLKQS
jgi:hypothetical protein